MTTGNFIVVALLVCVLGSWYYSFRLWKDTTIRSVSTLDDDLCGVSEWDDISAHELGEIEGKIPGLTQVIVAAHRVEEPRNGLRQAVKDNLGKNVEYSFLVSKCHEKSETDGWIQVFLAIAHVMKSQLGSQWQPSDLIHISNLSFDWRDTPYIFYRSTAGDGKVSIIAFRGNQVDEGIAARYVRLPAWLAYSMALALLSDAPRSMHVERPQFSAAGAGDDAAPPLKLVANAN